MRKKMLPIGFPELKEAKFDLFLPYAGGYNVLCDFWNSVILDLFCKFSCIWDFEFVMLLFSTFDSAAGVLLKG